MTTAPNTWIRVPVGEGSDSWSTFGRTRKVLAVAHSVTSIARLLDVLTVFENDTRVHVLFTRIAASAFDDGVADALTELGARTLPWKQAVGTRFDLAIAASHSGDLHEITAPIVLMPHGIGYNKYLRTQNTEHRTQNTEHRTQNTEHRTQNTERFTGWRRSSCCIAGA